MARLLHTSDWHLGRVLYGRDLIDEQAYVLERFLDIARESRPDCVIVAGDVYDRAIPPPAAVRLLDRVLSTLVGELDIPVAMIAGNHDSPDRLVFGADLLAKERLHIAGGMGLHAPVTLVDAFGPLEVHLLPYAEPARVRTEFGDESIRGHEQAFRAMTSRILKASSVDRRVLVAHAFAAGGAESESERPLSVGGAGTVPLDAFDGFCYSALGHLHRPQRMGSSCVWYSGSLSKYSVSEVDHNKGVNLVEIGREGDVEVEHIPLKPRRDLRRIEGYLQDLVENPIEEGRDDFFVVRLLDDHLLENAMLRLRQVYPNVVHLERQSLGSLHQPDPLTHKARERDALELFKEFHRQATGSEMTEQELEVVVELLSAQADRDREVLL